MWLIFNIILVPPVKFEVKFRKFMPMQSHSIGVKCDENIHIICIARGRVFDQAIIMFIDPLIVYQG